MLEIITPQDETMKNVGRSNDKRSQAHNQPNDTLKNSLSE